MAKLYADAGALCDGHLYAVRGGDVAEMVVALGERRLLGVEYLDLAGLYAQRHGEGDSCSGIAGHQMGSVGFGGAACWLAAAGVFADQFENAGGLFGSHTGPDPEVSQRALGVGSVSGIGLHRDND